MELKTLSTMEAKANLSEIYHEQFDETVGNFLTELESLLFAADCSFSSRFVGFLIVTSIRLVSVSYEDNQDVRFGGRKRALYYKQGNGWSEVVDKRYCFPTPLASLSRDELKKRQVRDYSLQSLERINRNEYPLDKSNNSTSVIEINLARLGQYTLGQADGNRLYTLLLEAIQRGGRLDVDTRETGNPEVVNNWISELERLRSLHREGALSDDQFERAKIKLLGT